MPLSVASLVLAALLAATPALPAPGHAAMIREPLADGWRFAYGSLDGAERPDFDDRAWEAVTLPHTWNAQDAFTKEPSFREGTGWYRRTVTLGPEIAGRRVIVGFGAANQVADVWWNGVHVGRHAGGYTRFGFDVTAAAHPGANVLAARVDNRIGPIPPLIADYDFYGGLYRDAWLAVTEPVDFDVVAGGAYAECRDVSKERATVVAHARIVNATDAVARVTLNAVVRDADGREILTTTGNADVPAHDTLDVALPSRALEHPRLWSPDAPNLYKMEIELRREGRVVSTAQCPLGVRWFAVDSQHGFTLNGRPLRLNGTNRHQDRAGYGSAVPDPLQREDVRRIKADGFNFVRLAHYPQSEAVLDECDRLGLVVWEEIPVVNQIDTSAAFADNARNMLREMIAQHRAHPSVAFWGLANEVLLIKPNPLSEGYARDAARLVRALNDEAKALDPSRLTAAAVSFDELDDGSGIQDVPDVLGLNLYFGWYYRTLDSLGPWLDDFHARHPRRPIVISEYGADSDERVHSKEPKAFDFSIEYQQRFHESTFPQFVARQWLVGTAVWNQFDFGSRRRDDTKPNLNKKGLYFFDRRPKDVAYYYRARLSKEPVLHIAARDWPKHAGSRSGDERVEVTVYSNLAEVELLQDGQSLGKRKVTNAAARWTVKLRGGANQLVALDARDRFGARDDCTVMFEDRGPKALATQPHFTLAMTASACTYLDSSNVAWEPARPFQPGSCGTIGGRAVTSHHRIFRTPDDALFQTSLDGIEGLRFDVPDGDYELELRFAETEGRKPGERVFDVTANGSSIVSSLDLAAGAGPFTAVTRTANVRATGGTGVRVEFRGVRGATTLSAARLTRR